MKSGETRSSSLSCDRGIIYNSFYNESTYGETNTFTISPGMISVISNRLTNRSLNIIHQNLDDDNNIVSYNNKYVFIFNI